MASRPLPRRTAWRGVGRCAMRTVVLLLERRIHLPGGNVGRVVRFADGTEGRVYRETVLDCVPAAPCVLVVAFRLRWIRGPRGHALFRAESILNTPLFVGFPGFVSKLWFMHDQHGVYRGLYEWDGEDAAETYARSLWRVLELVCRPGTIDYRVVPGVRREQVLKDPALLLGPADAESAWWRVVAAT